MKRHAKVLCETRNSYYYAPYGDDCDVPRYKMSIAEQVASWCKNYGLEDAILIETASKSHLRERLY